MLKEKLLSTILSNLKQTQEIWVASALVTDKALEIVQRNLALGAVQNYLIGIHLPSPVSAWKKLKQQSDNGQINLRLYTQAFFHPKVYVLKTPTGYRGYVGSGNFTEGGINKNKELFVEITDTQQCKELIDWFTKHYAEGQPVNDNFIALISAQEAGNNSQESHNTRNAQILVAALNNEFDIDAIDFTDQFFTKDDHIIFSPQNCILDNAEIDEERKAIRSKMYKLHDLIQPRLYEVGKLHPHYDVQHIVSTIDLYNHHSEEIGAMWIAYGRDKKQLKQYNEYATPLIYIRVQVIIHYESIGVWLMPGKKGGSIEDRQYFKQQMKKDSVYRGKFFNLLTGLGENYWILINGEDKDVTDFETADELQEFTKKDDWHNYYFTIGRTYNLGTEELKSKNIVDTIISDFKKYYPLYEHMMDKTFD